jgi:hypothetical protein
MNLIERIQVECFKAIFDGLTESPSNCKLDAFLKAVIYTCDENFDYIIRHKSKYLVQYLEMLKGNILCSFYYSKGCKEHKRGLSALADIDYTLKAIREIRDEVSVSKNTGKNQPKKTKAEHAKKRLCNGVGSNSGLRDNEAYSDAVCVGSAY